MALLSIAMDDCHCLPLQLVNVVCYSAYNLPGLRVTQPIISLVCVVERVAPGVHQQVVRKAGSQSNQKPV
jgi:hypothetical protein